ncbi:MAG: AmpG family muropeptide MFS transporter [Fibrobacter sp.]|nr:AmpG family muropeptide MFS transporter [Fibrobacter sp.]
MWCCTTYFAEGFPFTLIRTVSSVFFRIKNVSLESIGLTSLYGLPWVLKFLWAPYIDRFGTKRQWMLVMQIILATLFVLAGLFVPIKNGIICIAVLFLAGSVIASTHDIAIDGYYMEALDKNDQAKYVGYRVMAYRIGMMAGTGLIVTIGSTIGWLIAFICAGILLGALFIWHLFFLKECETGKKSVVAMLRGFVKPQFVLGVVCCLFFVAGLKSFLNSNLYLFLQAKYSFLKNIGFSGWTSVFLLLGLSGFAFYKKRRLACQVKMKKESFYSQAFLSFMDQGHIGFIISCIILLRTGEFLLSAMVSPFMVDLGISNHYGWISALIGLPASIIGALIGGSLISHYSLKKMVLPFLLAQNGTNIIYMGLAFFLDNFVRINTGSINPMFIGFGNLTVVASVHGFDQFAGGLGTAILMTFLMQICRGKYKAAHYAIGSGLMSLSGLFTGVISGFLAARMGYGYFFGFSFILSIPGMIMAIPAVKLLNKEKM